MRICYFGSYDPDYPRNRLIRRGLEKNGVEVTECRVKYSSLWKVYIQLLRKYLSRTGGYDAVIIGETGYLYVPLVKILTLLSKKPVILDAFFSEYDNHIDRKVLKENSFKAKKLFYEDKLGCRLADMVLLDTDEHIRYFRQLFGLNKVRFKRIFIGADDTIFYPRENHADSDSFLVFFHGTYIPLHGIEYIIRAAKLLEKYKDIKFLLIGDGQTMPESKALCSQLALRNISLLPLVKEGELPEYIIKANVCLGVFGDTPKTKRVIPHKVYQILAMKKPLITGDSPAIREVIVDKKHAILCETANPHALAEAILLLKNDIFLSRQIAENGYKLFREQFTPEIIGKQVKELLQLNL
ncbi:MAG: glycosyltransferase family 4 protein [Elusimicrobia bacterium]|nr:glycosyltransferase family 4 protein [Elusimicrobiota bacterium]